MGVDPTAYEISEVRLRSQDRCLPRGEGATETPFMHPHGRGSTPDGFCSCCFLLASNGPSRLAQTRQTHHMDRAFSLRLAGLSLLALFFGVTEGMAFHVPDHGAICGTVVLAETGGPATGATIHLPATNRHVVAKRDGRFCIRGVSPGLHDMTVRRVGRVAEEREVQVAAGQTTNIRVSMVAATLESEGITVTAEEISSSTEGTASRIGRSAIEHVQASSLAGLLELVPGQLATNPSLADPQESLLRQVPTEGDADRANALGTSLVINGAPVSNTANLQVDVPSPLRDQTTDRPRFASTAGGGIDLRRISPDQISSIEVVRGVPSARHGDLTAGMIRVETRAGDIDPELRLRLNPTTFDLGGAAGWGNGRTTSGWSTTANVATSQDDPRQTKDRFYRLNWRGAWTQPWLSDNRLSTTLRFSGYRTLDERESRTENADRTRYSQNQGVRANLSGHWRSASSPAWEVSWQGSVDYSEQEGYVQERVTQPGSFPLTDARIDTTREAEFGPVSYPSEVTTQGRPLNVFSRIEGERPVQMRDWRFEFQIGTEFRYSNNYGAGRQFDPLRPPRLHYNLGDRPRSYDEIPGLPIWSSYVDLETAGTVFDRAVVLHAGLRFDNIDPTSPVQGRFGTVLGPRVNLQYEITDDITGRAAYGRMGKAPSMNYLYPGPSYFDIPNLNYYPQDPDERLLLLTTRVVNPSNDHMTAYTNDKMEIGLEGTFGGVDASLTGFVEHTRGAYGLTLRPVTLNIDRYAVVEERDGRPPIITDDPVETETLVRAYHAPEANRDIDSHGIEFSIDVPEIPLLRTSLNMTGAWTTTRFQNQAEDVDTDALFRTQPPPERIGIYRNDGTERNRFVTSLRFIHRVPEVGLTVSLLAQTTWWDRERAINISERPIGYLTRDGERVDLSPSEAAASEYDALERTRSDRYYRTDDPPPLWLFNMRVSKALPSNLELSLFVNNVFANRPLHAQSRDTGLTQRNPPLFFGVEFVAHL